MTFTYNSQIMGSKGFQELMICILSGNGNPIDSFCHKLTKKQVLEIISAKKGAHHFGIKGWTLDPADHYQGYAEKQ
jgi:hypothetical protein